MEFFRARTSRVFFFGPATPYQEGGGLAKRDQTHKGETSRGAATRRLATFETVGSRERSLPPPGRAGPKKNATGSKWFSDRLKNELFCKPWRILYQKKTEINFPHTKMQNPEFDIEISEFDIEISKFDIE